MEQHEQQQKNSCIRPFTKKDEPNIPFPCGRCINCKKKRVSTWSFRLQQEAKRSTSAWFITLTYNTDTVPISPKGRMTLDKTDYQLFMKRLRKLHKGKLKYYTCGEYGTQKYRPHYHAILFNAELKHLIGESIAGTALQNKDTMLTGKTQFKCKTWGKGEITIGRVSAASIGYVLEYISKKERIPQYDGDDRIPEFSLMSKGMGANYFAESQKIISWKVSISKVRKKGNLRNTILLRPKKIYVMKKAIVKWHISDMYNRYYAPLPDGRKIGLPRFYREKIYTEMQRQKVTLHIEKTEYDRNMALTYEEKQKEQQTLHAWQAHLATMSNTEKRSLKY